jgi:hypothetical protein
MLNQINFDMDGDVAVISDIIEAAMGKVGFEGGECADNECECCNKCNVFHRNEI